MPDMYVARRSMDYGRAGNESRLDRGQIFELQGLVNDEKLVRLGYATTATKGIAIVQCGKCAAKFTTDEALASHGRDRHSIVSLTPAEEDERADKRAKMEDEIAPLDLTKTAASRGVRTHTGR